MSRETKTRSEFVRELSPDLSNDQRQRLQSMAHDLHPLVLVGQNGVGEGLVENFENQLLAHELIKVKVHGGDRMRSVARQLCEATDAQLVQSIGNILLFYQRHPEDPQIL